MRPILVVLGALTLIMGIVFALQGAGLVPTTFMTGPTWIAIGSGVAVLGVALTVLGARTG
ncbi:MAG: hypothetical protein ACE5JE_02085 [Thermoplasmata archaeon]